MTKSTSILLRNFFLKKKSIWSLFLALTSYNHVKIMSNVYILKDIKNRGHRLGSAYEQELEKNLRTTIDFNSEITDFNEKLQSEYSEREKEFENKANQLI